MSVFDALSPASLSREEDSMSPTLTALGIDRLSVEESLTLVQEIWDSIAAEVERAPLPESQRREIDSRAKP